MKRLQRLIVIPARLASTRLPNKMLADLGGLPLIARTYLRLPQTLADRIVVATDAPQIAAAIQQVGGIAVLTSPVLTSGTARCAQALQELAARGLHFDWVVNVQGDEPFIAPQTVAGLFDGLEKGAFNIASVMQPLANPTELHNPNIVKVLCAAPKEIGRLRKALYFSRAPLPFLREPEDMPADWPAYRHLGLYGFSAPTLANIPKLPPSTLEHCEKLEQLAWLEAGLDIGMLTQPLDKLPHISIDTAADLDRARQLLADGKI